MIEVQTSGLVHIYPAGIKALDGVDFVAGPGEFTVLLGPNGSGKTTLLKHFVRLLKPSAGSVFLDGRDIATIPMQQVRTDVGFVFQDPNDQLFAATVGEDVAYGPKNLGLSPTEVSRRVLEALDIVGARGLENRSVHSLSYGQKRRVALAGVLAMHPKVLVLDEPTAGLDPLGAMRMMSLLRRISEEKGITVIVATHDIDLVPAYATKVCLMRDGRLIASGTPPAIFARGDLLRQTELRAPRAAQALKLVGDELGQPIASLPLTMESPFVDQQSSPATDGTSGTVDWYAPSAGFTSGAAAAAAAKAAAELLLRGKYSTEVELRSPLGSIVKIPIANVAFDTDKDGATATVIKQGLSPDDITDGAEIRAFVARSDEPGVTIDGGLGVGRVVKPGLAVAVGEAAINPVPRQMISDALAALLPSGMGLKVIISVPRGEELAKRTDNVASGIVGGIAILGTTLSKEFGR